MFSGIGGFSYAFKDACRTVAYCEKNPACHQVLRARMEDGTIDDAPIYTDVKCIDARAMIDIRPVVITAGFPCQDLSSANPSGKGLSGDRSSMVSEVLRLTRFMPCVRVLVLENSPRIEKRGVDDILASLDEMGWRFETGLFQASDCGAPMQRKRWVLLGLRNPRPSDISALRRLKSTNVWRQRSEPRDRLIVPRSLQHASQHRQRCRLLGNGVVPSCMSHGVETLLRRILNEHDEAVRSHVVSMKLRITLDDGNGVVLRRDKWATPTVSAWFACRQLTQRSRTLLINQLYHARGPQHHLSHGCANARWVEWLMGYPPDYTAVATCHR